MGRLGIGHERFYVFVVSAGELNAEVGSAFEVSDDMFGSIDVAWRWAVAVLCDDIGDGGYVWSSLNGEPVEGADDGLKLILEALTFR